MKNITIKVKAPKLKTTGYYVLKTSDAWFGLEFKNDNTIGTNSNYCPGSACGMVTGWGNYNINGNVINASFTYSNSEDGYYEYPEPVNVTITIKNENVIVLDGKEYVYQDSFW